MTSWSHQNQVQPIAAADISYVGDDSFNSQTAGSGGQQVLVSERVQTLASTIYKEFETILQRYDENAVKTLMPVVVSTLEQLDLSLTTQAELQAEMEILKSDNGQLLAQYEREKAQRKSVAARCNEVEDAKEDEIKQLRGKVDSLESIVRLLDARLKNSNEHGSRSEERYEELKREYSKLHDRYTELFRSHVEYVDRTKSLFGMERSDSQSTVDRVRYQRQSTNSNVSRAELSANTAGATDSVPNSKRISAEFTEDSLPRDDDSNRNSMDLNSEMSRTNDGSATADYSIARRAQQTFVGGELDMEAEVANFDSSTERPSIVPQSLQKSDLLPSKMHASAAQMLQERELPAAAQPQAVEPYESSSVGVSALSKNSLRNFYSFAVSDDLLGTSVAANDVQMQKGESDLRASVPVGLQRPFSADSDEFRIPSESNAADQNPGVDLTAAPAIDDATSRVRGLYHDANVDFSGMRKVTEHLIKENVELLEKKNALNVLKDDLFAQIEEANSERMLLSAEIESLKKMNLRLEQRVGDYEDETRRLREELTLEKKRRNADDEDDDAEADADADAESSVPYAQRKRFTRLEMARVLMERNMYKERLYELQESFRFAESARAARELPDAAASNRALPQQQQQAAKKKSSVWNLFSGLFASGASVGASGQPVVKPKSTSSSTWYTPSTSGLSNLAASSTPRGRSRTSIGGNSVIDSPQIRASTLLQSAAEVQLGSASRRRAHFEERRSIYHRIRDYLQSTETERLTAYGWSLPPKLQTRIEAESKTALMEIPVPVYVRPLDTKGGLKIWCAAAVNLQGFDLSLPISEEKPVGAGAGVGVGLAREVEADGAASGRESEEAEGNEALFRFEREIERALENLSASEKEKQALTSIVWVSATVDNSSSQVVVVDANNRGEILARFTVSADRLTAICSVPGHQPATDYVSRPTNLRKATALQSASLRQSRCDVGGRTDDDAESQAYKNRRKQESASSPSRMVATLRVPPPTAAPTKPAKLKNSHIKLNFENDSLESTDAEDNELDDAESGDVDVDVEEPTDPLGVAHDAVRSVEPSVKGSEESTLDELSANAVPTRLPTVWLGSSSGWIYVHSAVASWRRCLAAVRLHDAVLALAHSNGRVFVALADGRVVVFFRDSRTREWDVTRYAVVPLAARRAVRCVEVVAGSSVWCAAGNRIHVVDAESLEIKRSFEAHPRRESRVQQVAWVGDGVWLAMRPSATIRLFHAFTYEHLQDVDVEPLIERVLGPTPFTATETSSASASARVTSLMVACDRLWIGTATGVTLTLPFVAADRRPFILGASNPASTSAEASVGANVKLQRPTATPGGPMRVLYEDTATQRIQPGTSFVPYANAQLASLSFHSHRDAIRFFICAPTRTAAVQRRGAGASEPADVNSRRGSIASASESGAKAERGATTDGWLVVSGGEGYIDVRHGDPETDGESTSVSVNVTGADAEVEDDGWKQRVLASKQERSHLIVWQVIVA